MSTIAGNVKEILAEQKQLASQVDVIRNEMGGLFGKLDELLRNQAAIQAVVDKILADLENDQNDPTGFQVVITRDDASQGGTDMPAPKTQAASMDFEINPDGTATATLTPHDRLGSTTTLPASASVPIWSSSAPASLTITPAVDGLSAVLADAGVTANGISIMIDCTLSDGTVIHADSDTELIDVVPGGPTGFKVALSSSAPPNPPGPPTP